jgi:N-acetylglucosaminyldiphosphoundecaprenol N-acetyl-beta-D-mannosaminyltransferase
MVTHFINAFSVTEFFGSKGLAKELNGQARWVADGVGGVIYFWASHGDYLSRLPGPDFMMGALIDERIQNLNHAIIGGSEQSSTSIQQIARERFGVNFAVRIVPPFNNSSSWPVDEYVSQLKEASVDVCWVALGTPLQDSFAHELLKRYSCQYFCIGAAIDFLSGNVARAPFFVRKMGIEWLFRLLTEPRRLWKRYTLGSLKFAVIATKSLFKRLILRFLH